jgi:hypothetical protein
VDDELARTLIAMAVESFLSERAALHPDEIKNGVGNRRVRDLPSWAVAGVDDELAHPGLRREPGHYRKLWWPLELFANMIFPGHPLTLWGTEMPINRLLTDSDLTPEQRHVITLAFDQTLRKLNLVDRNDPLCDMIAHRVIEVATNGVTDAVGISEVVVKQFLGRQL